MAVSVPTDPVPIAAGARERVTIRVVNVSHAPITVTISGRAVRLLDNGAVRLDTKPASDWQGRVAFPTAPIKIAARSYRSISLAVHVPRQVSPDLYFIGFLVTPLPTRPGGLQIINRIGSFLTIDVPGPRLLKLKGSLQAPSFVLGSSAQGTIRVRNVGHAVIQFWGENDTTSWPAGGQVHQQRFDTRLLPIGTSRSFSVSGKPAWPIGRVTIRVLLIYHGPTETTTRQLTLSKRVLVVNPVLFSLVLALLAAAVLAAYRLLRRHRRRRWPRTAHTDAKPRSRPKA